MLDLDEELATLGYAGRWEAQCDRVFDKGKQRSADAKERLALDVRARKRKTITDKACRVRNPERVRTTNAERQREFRKANPELYRERRKAARARETARILVLREHAAALRNHT